MARISFMLKKALWVPLFLGIAFALLTLLLKVFPTPCIKGNCGEVLHSPYGSILGVPVSVFGLSFWAAILWCPRLLWRQIAIGMLVAGTLYFVAIQYWVLGQFCIFCLAHATCVLLFLPAWNARAWVAPPPLQTAVYALVCGAFFYSGNKVWVEWKMSATITQGVAHKTAVPAPTVLPPLSVNPIVQESPLPQSNGIAIPWLSPHVREGVLVLSVTCPHCVTLMKRAMEYDFRNKAAYPLVFQTNAHSFEKTAVFLAAILTQEPSEAFPFALALVPEQTLLSGSEQAVRQALEPAFPDLGTQLENARELLRQQKEYLVSIGDPGTPFLLSPEGVRAHLSVPLLATPINLP